MIAPASRRRRTASASRTAGLPPPHPNGVVWPARSTSSLIATGTPSRGAPSPAARRRSASSAAASASSAQRTRKAFSVGCALSARSSAALDELARGRVPVRSCRTCSRRPRNSPSSSRSRSYPATSLVLVAIASPFARRCSFERTISEAGRLALLDHRCAPRDPRANPSRHGRADRSRGRLRRDQPPRRRPRPASRSARSPTTSPSQVELLRESLLLFVGEEVARLEGDRRRPAPPPVQSSSGRRPKSSRSSRSPATGSSSSPSSSSTCSAARDPDLQEASRALLRGVRGGRGGRAGDARGAASQTATPARSSR